MIPRDFEHIQKAFAVIDTLGKIETKSDLVLAVTDLTRDFGFESFVVTRLPMKEQRVRSHVLLHSGWDEWLYNYDRFRYYASDPVVQKCFETVEPFLWHEAVRSDLPLESLKMMDDAASRGMTSGLAIPVVDHNGFHSVVSLVGGSDALLSYEKRALQLFGYYVHGAAERVLRSEPETHALSDREIEVLHLLARGKTIGEIASQLSISPETIKTHVKRARAKLNTCNITHTVVEALRSRQLKI